jgi:very-short-patch-repair endonuclease
MPVRQLLSKTPTVFPLLKPCLLMSPLSVAQYLAPDQDAFDLVVFDEASQIPVWDAIGAIARGKQVIVAGDPKQLPPTNFFSRTDDDELPAEDGLVDDLESILDECLGAGIPEHHLTWHYRSRHEGLIAFSNHHYYNDRLLTFPSATSDSPGVRWVHVANGVYDKGGTRTNRAEGQAVVAEIVRRLSHKGNDHPSIGVVTFSQAQQDLVENLLDDARRGNPELEPYFDAGHPEPVFVKNLENVQGDERDVILFSIGYGPDSAGRLSMNFGPLNRDGGERRLNVAITRAKCEVVIFSTLRADQIDLGRTKATGVADLKAYLEYAERGPAALAGHASQATVDGYESLFEEEVGEFLKSQGFEVRTQVGCSGYRVDLAIVDAENVGRFLVGIECDGATYHRAATSRDRDRLRQTILEGLGWTIVRVWSTDWWRNRAAAEDRLVRSIEDAAKAALHTKADARPPVDPAGPASVQASDDSLGIVQAEVREALHGYPGAAPRVMGKQDAFYADGARSLIREQVERIVTQEGPMVESLLVRRVQDEWGIGRAGVRIRNAIDAACPASIAVTTWSDERVFWPRDIDPRAYDGFRVPRGDDPNTKRQLDQVPAEELRNAMRYLLNEYMSLPMDDLFRETLRLFGGKQLSRAAKARLERVFEELKGDVLLD